MRNPQHVKGLACKTQYDPRIPSSSWTHNLAVTRGGHCTDTRDQDQNLIAAILDHTA